MAEGIYTPDGTLIPFSRADLGTELATRQNAGVFFGELDGWLNALPDPDPVLRKRGDDAAILRELSADDQVTTAMLSRKNRVLNCPHFSFRAGAPEGETPMPEAEELHRRFMRDLERTNLRTIISGMLDAPFYGFTPLELIWRRGRLVASGGHRGPALPLVPLRQPEQSGVCGGIRGVLRGPAPLASRQVCFCTASRHL